MLLLVMHARMFVNTFYNYRFKNERTGKCGFVKGIEDDDHSSPYQHDKGELIGGNYFEIL